MVDRSCTKNIIFHFLIIVYMALSGVIFFLKKNGHITILWQIIDYMIILTFKICFLERQYAWESRDRKNSIVSSLQQWQFQLFFFLVSKWKHCTPWVPRKISNISYVFSYYQTIEIQSLSAFSPSSLLFSRYFYCIKHNDKRPEERK